MENFDRRTVGNLCRLQLMEQKAHVGKALLCAGLVIILSLIVHVGDLEESCAYAAKWAIVLSFLLPSVWVFARFIEKNRGGKDHVLPASHLDKYVSLWITAIVDICVWLAVVGVVSVGVLWSVGNYFYDIPLVPFLEKTFSGFTCFSLVGMCTLVVMSVTSAIAWHIRGAARYVVPTVMVVAALLPFFCLSSETAGENPHLLAFTMSCIYGALSLVFFVWGYFLFKKLLP